MEHITPHDILVLDAIIKTVDAVALPGFSAHKDTTTEVLKDDALLELLAELRSYSATKSDLVSKMIKSGALAEAFSGFAVKTVSNLNADDILEKHWDKIKVIRFKNKVKVILRTAKAMAAIAEEFGGFQNYLEKWDFPKRVIDKNALDVFWEKFDALIEDLKKRKMPIINNEITLLHFLETHMRFYCLKPDVVVMRVAENTGLVCPGAKGSHRALVKKVQEYCFGKAISPRLIDRYLLAFGGQAWATKLVKRSYCIKSGLCASPDCHIGNSGLCPTWGKKQVDCSS